MSEALEHRESHGPVVTHKEVYETIGIGEVGGSTFAHRVATVGAGQRFSKLGKVVQVQGDKVLNDAAQGPVNASQRNRNVFVEFGHSDIVGSMEGLI